MENKHMLYQILVYLPSTLIRGLKFESQEWEKNLIGNAFLLLICLMQYDVRSIEPQSEYPISSGKPKKNPHVYA